MRQNYHNYNNYINNNFVNPFVIGLLTFDFGLWTIHYKYLCSTYRLYTESVYQALQVPVYQ